jgi:glutamyl-tRNA reductase
MHIILVGLNHNSAPLEVRERLAVSPEHLPDWLQRLKRDAGLQEAAILSTCNRVEIYGRAPEADVTLRQLEGFLSAQAHMTCEQLHPHLYRHTEPHSVRHLFAVTSGLDSMVLGEDEILGQVKRAYEHARASGATGKVLNVLFQRALNAAKAVRSETSIGQGQISVGSVAVDFAQKIFGQLTRALVLLIGAGEISELTLQRLKKRGVRQVRVINRSPERAEALARYYGATPVAWEALPEELVAADIVISSTSAPQALLTRERVWETMRQRHQRPLCLIDLGVPRNIEPAVGELENVYRFDVDDLQRLVAQSCHNRQAAALDGAAIVDHKVAQFLSWWQEELAHGPKDVATGHAPQA